MFFKGVLCLAILVHIAISVRINFSTCLADEWICLNNVPNDITYICPVSQNEVNISYYFFIVTCIFFITLTYNKTFN